MPYSFFPHPPIKRGWPARLAITHTTAYMMGFYSELTFSNVTFVDKARYHMTIVNVEIIMRSKYIRRDYTSKHTSILIIISPIEITQIKVSLLPSSLSKSMTLRLTAN